MVGILARPDARAVALADVLDGVKASHPDGTISADAAEALVALVEGLISPPSRSTTSHWRDVLGPVLTPGVVVELLSLSRAGLDKRRDSGAVLGVQTDNGRWVYPLRQFRSERGRITVLPGLRDVLDVLLPPTDGLAAARWLATPNRRLAAATPWDVLANGDQLADLIDAAHAQARA